MFKTDWKQDNIISLPRERSWETDWLCENTRWVNYWLRRTKTKPNTAAFHSCTITANILENSKKLKRRTHVKSNLKIRNRVISSPRDENITPLWKEDESRKSKRRKNYFEISRIWTELNKWPLWLFSQRLCSSSHEAKKCLNEAKKLNKQSAWKLP